MMFNSLNQVFVIFFILLKTVLVSMHEFTASDGKVHIVERGREKYNWYEAYNYCRKWNATPITIYSEEDQLKLMKLLNDHFPSDSYESMDLWIGGQDRLNKVKNFHRKWYSPNGELYTYTNWYSTEPDNSNGKKNCAAMLGYKYNYTWAARSCDEKLGFICSYDSHYPSICDLETEDSITESSGTEDSLTEPSRCKISEVLQDFWNILTLST